MSREYSCKFCPHYSADTLAEFGQHVRRFHSNELLKIWEGINDEDRLVTDGGHLPSDPSAADQQAAWRNYEERHITVRFEQLWCGDCNTHREHRIEHDHLRGFGETECRSCHTVDLVLGEDGGSP